MRHTRTALLLLSIASSTLAAAAADATPPAAGPSGKSITQADLLARLIDLDRLFAPPAGQRTGMFSSRQTLPPGEKRDQTPTNNSGNCGQFMRTQADGWSVMGELSGPGALTRIWSPNPQGQIRIVLDETASFELPLADLFSGRTPPFEEPLCYVSPDGGQTCYFPIGFAKSCRVLARDCASCYEINYVLFPPDTAVQTFSRELDEPAGAALDAVITALYAGQTGKRPGAEGRTYALSDTQELGAGEKLTAESFAGGGVVRSLQVAITDARLPEIPYLLHQFVLRIYFDGEQQPSVEAPLIEFFGSGFGLTRYCSLVGGTDLWTSMPGEATSDNLYRITHESRFLYCYFPMPFADTARIEIEAPQILPKAKHVGLKLYARIERQKPPADALRFHAHFRKEDPCEGPDFAVLEARGPGRIVGCVLNVDCPRPAWWGAGGEKIWVDGQGSPAYVGTGADGLLGGARAPELQSLPLQAQSLHGVTRTGSFGKRSGYRWFVPDSIEFERNVRFALENVQEGGARDTYFGTLVYWYADARAGAASDAAGRPFFPALTPKDLTPPPLRIAGAVEVEDHVLGDGWGKVLKEQYADGGELSGKLAAIITTDQPVQINIPSRQERRVRLSLRMHQLASRFFDTVEVLDPAGKPLATVKYDRESGGIYRLGTVRLRAGDNIFTVVCSKKAVLDCWILEDAPEEPSSAPSAP
jgi:hypothetical protein